jgi:hypothetical protein
VALHRSPLEHLDQRPAQIVHAARRRLVDPCGQAGGACSSERRQQEQHVDVEPRRAQQMHRRRDRIGEHAPQRRREREAKAAGGGECRQIERPSAPRRQTDRQIHHRDAVATPERTGDHGFDRDRPQPVR